MRVAALRFRNMGEVHVLVLLDDDLKRVVHDER
jgi:hypothetical protein